MPLALARGRATALAITLAALWIARVALVGGHRPGRALERHASTVILALLLIVYLANGRTLVSGDAIPARYLPLAILRAGTFTLDALRFLHAECVPYYLALVGGHHLSAYPVGAALAALPLYVPAALAGVPAEHRLFVELEKLAAALIVALSAVVLYHAARRIAGDRVALFATAAYALGGSSFSVSSQALWQHGPSQLGLAAALYCLLRGEREPAWLAGAGLPLSFAVLCRPSDALLAAPLAAYVLLRRPSTFPAFLLAGAPAALFQLWYHATYFGNAFRLQWDPLDADTWSTPIMTGLAGILFSPGRGLLVYSPIFALSIVGFVLAWRRGGHPLLRALGVGAGLTVLACARWQMWWGGATFGPRLLADLTPALALALCPVAALLSRHRPLAVGAALLLAWSIGAHAAGAFAHDYQWNAHVDVDRFPARLWSPADNQLVNPIRQVLGRAASTLRGQPTNRTAPERLAAAIEPLGPPVPTVAASSAVELELSARNTGEAAWLAWPRDADDVMVLVWRWRRPADGSVVTGGALPLYHDVAPGRRHRVRLRVAAPREPGAYALEVGLGRKRGGCVSPVASAGLASPIVVTASTSSLGRVAAARAACAPHAGLAVMPGACADGRAP
jgi:hypothetical protein